MAQDPRQMKWLGQVTNGEPPKRPGAGVKMTQQTHKFPIIATIISIVLLLVTIFFLMSLDL
jgi:hypothetical protein